MMNRFDVTKKIKNLQGDKVLPQLSYAAMPAWEWQLKLGVERLRCGNPIPIIMDQIYAIEGDEPQWENLYTILTELFVNAMDHGVLSLNSALKNSAEGFGQYFDEREKKLNNVDTGFVHIALKRFNEGVGGKILITVKDSGPGFDVSDVMKKLDTMNDAERVYSGRGLKLVKHLCETLEFKEKGSLVEVTYVWR
jgi:anti-sigma regulatory factor (Ser/Thr protein kinase)